MDYDTAAQANTTLLSKTQTARTETSIGQLNGHLRRVAEELSITRNILDSHIDRITGEEKPQGNEAANTDKPPCSGSIAEAVSRAHELLKSAEEIRAVTERLSSV